MAVIEDINARKRAELESIHDPLTGLLNRRGAAARLERELGRSAHNGEPIVVAFLDLDGFKKVNDRHGHAEGDRCLQQVAVALGETCRPSDSVARLGGDEFLVLLPGLACSAAGVVLQRLLDVVRTHMIALDHGVTASIGAICLHGGRAMAVEQAVAATDRLMYQAKQQGRDRFVLEDWPK